MEEEERKKLEKLIHFWENKLLVIQKFGDITSANFIQMTIVELRKRMEK